MQSKWIMWILAGIVAAVSGCEVHADDIKVKNAKSWELTGRVQMQHLYDTNAESDGDRTNNGFRMRRVRIQTKAKMNKFISGKVQFEVRDNSPSLKDAEAKVKLFGEGYLRVGQFKVPVWREEFKRSSGSLLMVERSEAAGFLADALLSARHVGLEIGGDIGESVEFSVNYSNGAGEGVREDAGRSKSDFVNNGKMVVGRVDVELNDNIELGVSGVMNSIGKEIMTTAGITDNTGSITAVAPDFGIYLKDAGLDIEGGAAFGSVSKDFTGSADINFTVLDITGRYMKKLTSASESLGGLDAVGFAAGFSYVDENGDVEKDEDSYLRFGPEFYFGSKTRLQINGELEMPARDGADSVFKVRSQFTLNL